MVKILVKRGQASRTRPLAQPWSPLNLRPYVCLLGHLLLASALFFPCLQLSHKAPNASVSVVRALLSSVAHKVACQKAFRTRHIWSSMGHNIGITLGRTQSISGHMVFHPSDVDNNTLPQPAFQGCRDHIRQHISEPLWVVQVRETSTQSPVDSQRTGQAPRPGLQPV